MENLDDQFACPVCFEIPLAEIFQCINGHIICNNCSDTVRDCPQCRVPYGADKIRTRVLEQILDSRLLDCPNTYLGCTTKTLRKNIPEHLRCCEFQEVSVPLCQILGYSCDFKTSSKKTADAIHHFKIAHQSPHYQKEAGKIILENFADTPINRTHSWTPVIFEAIFGNTAVIIFPKLNGSDQTLSLISILIGGSTDDATNYRTDYCYNPNREEVQRISWTTAVISLHHVEAAITVPVFRIPATLLKVNYATEGYLEVLMKVSDKRRQDVPIVNLLEIETSHVLRDLPISSSTTPMLIPTQTSIETISGYVHVGSQCDGCRISPIKGTRHNCLQCVNFDLCDKCKKSGKHSHHFFTKVRNHSEVIALTKLKHDRVTEHWKPLVSGDVVIEKHIMCSECQNSNQKRVATSTCKLCYPTYGLCGYCFLNKKHRLICQKHDFLQVIG